MELNKLVIKKIYAINSIKVQESKVIFRNDRTLYALAFKLEGKTVYVNDGKNYLSDREHMVFLPKNKPYHHYCMDMGECVMIEFDSDSVQPLGGEFTVYPVPKTNDIDLLVRRLLKLWTLKNSGYELQCMALTYELLSRIYIGQHTAYHTARQRKLLEPALNYIEEHYSDTDLSNELLANIVGVSTIYFRKIFTAIYNISPMKYVHNLRMEKAKDMLLGDYESVSSIAKLVGFTNIYSFSRTFKRHTGISPTDYTKQPE